jgi:hypothetical protein
VAGEKAYVDPDGRFAFCYPGDMQLVTGETTNSIATSVTHNPNEKNRVFVSLYWAPEHRNATGDPCVEYAPIVKNRHTEDYTISGNVVVACYVDHFDPSQPDVMDYKTIEMEVPAGVGGYVQVSVAYTGPDWTRAGVSVDSIAQRYYVQSL